MESRGALPKNFPVSSSPPRSLPTPTRSPTHPHPDAQKSPPAPHTTLRTRGTYQALGRASERLRPQVCRVARARIPSPSSPESPHTQKDSCPLRSPYAIYLHHRKTRNVDGHDTRARRDRMRARTEQAGEAQGYGALGAREEGGWRMWKNRGRLDGDGDENGGKGGIRRIKEAKKYNNAEGSLGDAGKEEEAGQRGRHLTLHVRESDIPRYLPWAEPSEFDTSMPSHAPRPHLHLHQHPGRVRVKGTFIASEREGLRVAFRVRVARHGRTSRKAARESGKAQEGGRMDEDGIIPAPAKQRWLVSPSSRDTRTCEAAEGGDEAIGDDMSGAAAQQDKTDGEEADHEGRRPRLKVRDAPGVLPPFCSWADACGGIRRREDGRTRRLPSSNRASRREHVWVPPSPRARVVAAQ
ncbi:hypothetical protein K438DRAFT_1778217 [Mycena galopus ATCC 62051]|nr:hypothetical protein K438DRAFT_1778217 [Mycena galopus ATCC 62051]